MKTRKLIYPLAMALAVVLSTGCRTHQPKTTPLPEPVIGQPPPPPPPPPVVNPTPPEMPPLTNFADMIPVRTALAAYTIHFAYDSSVIKGSQQANLAQVADKLKSAPDDKLQIEGNCDERGTEEYNRSLGERRALAAREALIKLGVDGTADPHPQQREGQTGGGRPR